MPTRDSVPIMDAEEIDRALTRIAHEILEKKGDPRVETDVGGKPCLVGIRTRGVPLAQRLQKKIGEIQGEEPALGLLDINLYRDDVSQISDHPVLRRTEIAFKVAGSRVVLVDDVLFTGRTVRAALEGLLDLGRPAQIQLAVLIDRGHRELPIRPDFVGKNVPTARNEKVHVRLAEIDDVDEVLVSRTGAEATEPGGDR